MKIIEIKGLFTTIELDPDEARVLAAACTVGAVNAEGSEMNESRFEEFGSAGMVGMLLDSYAAMFEAASMAGAEQFALHEPDRSELTLSAIRAHGTGARSLSRAKGAVAS